MIERFIDQSSSADWPALARRCLPLYTGALTDVLDGLGYPQQTLPPEIVPLRPGTRFAGPAFTIEGRPHAAMQYEQSIRRILEMLGAVPAHHVALYQTGDRESAHLGELSVTSLLARGAAGAVIDGGCRDVAMIVDSAFGVFSRYVTPQDCVPRWEVLGWGGEVTIGSVHVGPGDYVVADSDGVVVVPAALLEEALTRAEQVVGTENEVRRAVADGMLPLEAFERYGKF